MSLANRSRKDVNTHRQEAHGLMQQAVQLNTILTSPEYINATHIDKAHINGIAKNIVNDFNAYVQELSELDGQLQYFNNKQLTDADNFLLIQLDQQYISWGERYGQVVTPAVCAIVEYIQSQLGVI